MKEYGRACKFTEKNVSGVKTCGWAETRFNRMKKKIRVIQYEIHCHDIFVDVISDKALDDSLNIALSGKRAETASLNKFIKKLNCSHGVKFKEIKEDVGVVFSKLQISDIEDVKYMD